jgi:hypothetical protein
MRDAATNKAIPSLLGIVSLGSVRGKSHDYALSIKGHSALSELGTNNRNLPISSLTQTLEQDAQ